MKHTILMTPLLAMSLLQSEAAIRNLRCEYLTEPLGIDTNHPRLTWEFDEEFANMPEITVELSTNTSFKDAKQFATSALNTTIVDIDTIPGIRYYWKVLATDRQGKSIASKPSSFETGKFSSHQWNAHWIGDGNNAAFEPAPVFKKTFNIDEKPSEARAYISALGYYVLYINGKRVGDQHMDPGFTSYTNRSLYATHDITNYLKKGENVIEVTLGNGFANCQSRDAWGQEKAPWRSRPIFICEIQGDGKVPAAYDASWQTATGPVVYNNLYSGEHRDDNISIKYWRKAKQYDAPNKKLKSQSMPPIRPTATLDGSLLASFGDTIHVFDLGKNIAGVCELTVKGKKGTMIEMAHGELLKPDNRLEQGNLNIYYHPLKADESFQTDRYIIGETDKKATYQPEFTYHGFRYVEVRCSEPIPAADILISGKMVHTDLPRIGHFKCSNPLLNKIYDATMLSYVDNIHSIPTDCPQREKNGWTADAHVAMDLALLNYNGITFYEKWMNDFIDNQLENGNISGIIPSAGWGYGDSPGPVWDAALFIVPLAIYDYYGDSQILQRLYPTMLRYMDWLKSLEKEDGLLNCGIGDWLPYNTQTPTDFTSSLYAFADYKMMSRISKILGEDSSKWNEMGRQMKDRINAKWFDEEKALYANGSQAAQAIALYWDVAPEEYEKAVAKNLNDMVVENDYALDFGLLGSKSVLRMLTKYGYPETAFRMATRTSAPSWGHWIDECGYTTLAETWTLSPEFRDASLNHVFFGDIAAWMTNDIAGLNFDSSKPGFENIIIRPNFMESLDWAEADYQSVKGKITTRWERKKNGKIELSVTVPVGSEATIYLPDRSEQVGSGLHKFSI